MVSWGEISVPLYPTGWDAGPEALATLHQQLPQFLLTPRAVKLVSPSENPKSWKHTKGSFEAVFVQSNSDRSDDKMSAQYGEPRLEVIVEEEPNQSAQHFLAPLSMSSEATNTPAKRPRGPCRRRYCFSEGFHSRLEDLLGLAEGKPNITEGMEGNRHVVSVDFSSLNLEEMGRFERAAFELYYTDKSVKKLTFEGNAAKFWGDFVRQG